MNNTFDRLKVQAFGTTSRLMGYRCTWSPSEGGPSQTAMVTFMGPTEVIKVMDVEYNPNNYAMEYMSGTFPGLREAANSNRLEEYVTIYQNGVEKEYFVQVVNLKEDGDLCFAQLVIKQ